jgi:hypothetical protein
MASPERGRELAALTEPVYGSPQWAAQILGIPVSGVYRLAEDPTCPVLRLGPGLPDKLGRVRGTLRFPKQRFLDWLKSREQGVTGRGRRLRAVEREAGAGA